MISIVHDIGSGTVTFTGYAYMFGDRRLNITPEALERALTGDLSLRLGYNGPPIAATGDGTMVLEVDATGLKVIARLADTGEIPDDVDFSFTFQAVGQIWAQGRRTVTELTLIDVVLTEVPACPQRLSTA